MENLLAEARRQQSAILKEAAATRDQIVADARGRAREEAQKALDETRHQIAAEKESAVNDIRRQVAVLSVDVAEKILRRELSKDQEQLDFINRMIAEVESEREIK